MTTTEAKKPTALLTPKFRVSYPKVFKAELNTLSDKMEFSVVALFDPGADLTVLKDACEKACIENWGPDKNKWPRNLRSPFRPHEDRMKDGELPPGHVPGGIFITLRSTNKPGVVDENVQKIIDPTQMYGGCYAIAAVNVQAYPNTKKPNKNQKQGITPGVAIYLNHIQKVADGEPFGAARTAPEDNFAPVAGANTGNAGNTAFDPFR